MFLLLMLTSKKLHKLVNCGKSLRMGNVFVFLNWRITRYMPTALQIQQMIKGIIAQRGVDRVSKGIKG